MRTGTPRCLSLAFLGLACLVPAVLLGACGGGGGSGGEAPAAFALQSSDPIDGAFRVPLDQNITLVLSKPVDPATVHSGSIQLETEAGEPIAGSTFIVNGSGQTLRYTTIQFLAMGERHVCRIADDLRSADGEALQGADSIEFTAIVPNQGDLPKADQLRATAGQLNFGRQGHTATLLNDGRVLVVGGFVVGGTPTDTAELFSSVIERFTTLGSRMQEARAGHSATRLDDGRVLLAGGWYETGFNQPAVRASAEIYDPATGLFTRVGDLQQQRADHAAALLPNGRVLLTGGSDYNGGFIDLDDAEIFDPDTGLFTTVSNLMNTFRSTHGIVDRGDGSYVLAGGSLADLRPEVYSFFTTSFTPLNQAAQDAVRFGPALAMFESGAVAVAGGETTGTVLHIGTNGFVQNTGSGLSVPRSYATATRIKPDQILVAGGIDFSNGSFIESSCDVLIEGGFGGSNTLATPVRFSTGMAHHTATVLDNGDILFCGGLNEDGALPNKTVAFLFDVE